VSLATAESYHGRQWILSLKVTDRKSESN